MNTLAGAKAPLSNWLPRTTAYFATAVLLLLVTQIACRAEEPSYRMPEYAEGELPPLRKQEEVKRLLAGGVEPSADKKPLRVLLVAGTKDHYRGEHDYPNWQKVWKRLLALDKQTTVDIAWEFPDEQQLEAADVAVFYQHGRWDAARAAAMDPFLARGGGAVYIHWAVNAREEAQEMAKRIGLAEQEGTIKYRHGPIDVDFTHNPDHPISRNLTKVRWIDESYWRLRGDRSAITLLGTGVEEGKPRPLFWTVEQGRSRVFVSIPGHYSWTFDDPVFRTVLLRGIAWAGRRHVDRFNDLVLLDARVE